MISFVISLHKNVILQINHAEHIIFTHFLKSWRVEMAVMSAKRPSKVWLTFESRGSHYKQLFNIGKNIAGCQDTFRSRASQLALIFLKQTLSSFRSPGRKFEADKNESFRTPLLTRIIICH